MSMNIKRIKDSNILYQGNLTLGNVNDMTNLIYRCCPNVSPDEAEDIINQIEDILIENNVEKCSYSLSDESYKGASKKLGEIDLGNLTISLLRIK